MLYDLTYMWNLKEPKSQKQRVDWWLPGAGSEGRWDGRHEEILVKGYELPVIRGISSGDLMYSMVIYS